MIYCRSVQGKFRNIVGVQIFNAEIVYTQYNSDSEYNSKIYQH